LFFSGRDSIAWFKLFCALEPVFVCTGTRELDTLTNTPLLDDSAGNFLMGKGSFITPSPHFFIPDWELEYRVNEKGNYGKLFNDI